MNSKGNQIPPRWLDCPRKGHLISGKFLPFKTPLNNTFNDQVSDEKLFPASMLISSLASQKIKMGLWIDLTNTSRFYDSKEIEKLGPRYLKLQCKGRDECPTFDQTKNFLRECQKFISSNPLLVIGVHCTHGFNRTGFLIVAYLVEILDYSVEAAVEEFKKARPPGIYKSDYMRELAKRYGDPSDPPPTPSLPDWCKEYDDGDDDDGIPLPSGDKKRAAGDSLANNSPRKRRKEYVKKNPIFMEGVKGVKPILQQPKLKEIQEKCQNMCEWTSTGFPGSQPVSMDLKNLKLLSQKAYKVSWKADGTRYMMLLDGENSVFFVDRDNCVYQVSGIRFPRRKNLDDHICGTLLDGEMIIDKVDGKDHPRYLIYDIIRFENQEVGKTDFDRRLYCIAREIIGARTQAMQEGKIDKTKEPFSIRKKDFWDVAITKSVLGPKFTKMVGHEIDGLIFQPVPDEYVCGQSNSVLKWKPPSLNSVDFKLVITIEEKPGMLREKVGLLYVGSYDQPFSQIKVTKDLKLYDKKIIECKYENDQWKFMRERTDKSFPNSYKTAMAVCQSIREPVTDAILTNFIEQFRWKPEKKRPDEFAVPANPPKNQWT